MDTADVSTKIFSVRSGIGRTLYHMESSSSTDMVKSKMAKKVFGEDGAVIRTNLLLNRKLSLLKEMRNRQK